MQLDPLVKPRSVAIVGATDRTSPARSVIESLGALGFSGAVYPVNPKYPTVLNHVCYPSLADLPEAPDVVVFSIRKALVPEQLRLAIERGARASVIYDSGFAELGADGARLQEEIAGLCREARMPVCGPNCMGILNPAARVTTYKQTITKPEGLAGNVGFISQSGSVCIAILSDLRRFGISLSVSAGNEAVTRTVDYIEYLINDPGTSVIATFTETVREPERYVAALERAADAGKPVIVLKVGRSERTAQAITSHTGGLAGESRVFSEVLRAHRAIEVSDLEEMTEVLAVCQGRRWPRGRRISIVTGSGGLAEMFLDNAMAAGLDLPPLSAGERAEAERVIGRITGDGNPFDAWGNGDYSVNLPHAMSIVDKSDRIDAIAYLADTANEGHIGHPGRVLENVKMLAAAAEKSVKPFYLMSSRSGVMSSEQAKALRACGLVQIGGTAGLKALDRVGRYMMQRPPLIERVERKGGGELRDLPVANGGRRVLNEFDAKRVLAAHGLPVPRERCAATLSEVRAAAGEIGYPVVLKILSDEIPHKTDFGLVELGLEDERALAQAYERLAARVATLRQRPADTAFLVAQFVRHGAEVFAGVARDPDFGLALAFGMGGTGIEVTRDYSLRMLPLREGDAQAMIAETSGTAMLCEHRGRAAADLKSLAACLERLADFAVQSAELIEEIDLNPIKALPQGCIIVDALIVRRQSKAR